MATKRITKDICVINLKIADLINFKSEKKPKIKGYVLDLRNNPGGLLDQAVAVSNVFLDGGVVVATQGARAHDRKEEHARPGKGKLKHPVVVLVNGGSASASEIVAGALKNQGRALVIGEQTFGKGSVQMLYDFPDTSSLKLTIAHYLTPGDISIQSVGITPDTPVALYCFKGARASNTYLALKEAGVKDVKIYFGSWNEWSRDPSLPIEEGLPY